MYIAFDPFDMSRPASAEGTIQIGYTIFDETLFLD